MFEGSFEILIAFVAVLAAVGVVTMIIRAMNIPIIAAATVGVLGWMLFFYQLSQ
tara:strand:- start:373 stop:534 length:162 start_codon:yes stop_codon:yes gene_type:complete